MRGMKTARALSEIDYDLILEAAPEKLITVKRNFSWKYIAMAASIALVLCIGIFAVLVGTKSDSKYIDTDSTAASSEWDKKYVDPDSSSDSDREMNWDKMTLTEKYPTVQLSSSAATGVYMAANAPIEESRLAGKLLDGVVSVSAASFEGLVKSPSTHAPDHLSAEVYSIKNIDSKYAIALKFLSDASLTDDFDCFYVYINSSADPDSFETLVNALDFSATVSFSEAYYYPDDGRTIGFEGLDKTKILDILLENAKDAKSVADPDSMLSKGSYKKRLDLTTNIDVLGVRNKSLSVSDDGYLVTNLLSSAKMFYIGKQTAEKLIDHITSNYKGYEIVYNKTSDSSKAESSRASKDSSTASHTTSSKTDSSAAQTTTKPEQKPAEKSWEEKNYGERFPVIGEYHYAGITTDVVNKSSIVVGNAYETATGKDPLTGKEYKTNCYLFFYKDMDNTDLALFLFEDQIRPLSPSVDPNKDGGQDSSEWNVVYYVYVKENINIIPPGEGETTFDFQRFIKFSAAVCTNVDGSKTRYSNFNNEKINDALFKDTGIDSQKSNVADPSKINFKPSISMLFTYDNNYYSILTQSTLEISDDGYMRFTINDHKFMYSIGKETVQKLRGILMTTSKHSEPVTS